jgi:hypothetical protein
MKIPKKLKIGGHMVTVDSTKNLRGVDGDWDSGKNLIRISADLAKSQKEVTLFHEVFHALNATMSEQQSGHNFLESFAQQVYQVLADNKLLK